MLTEPGAHQRRGETGVEREPHALAPGPQARAEIEREAPLIDADAKQVEREGKSAPTPATTPKRAPMTAARSGIPPARTTAS